MTDEMLVGNIHLLCFTGAQVPRRLPASERMKEMNDPIVNSIHLTYWFRS